MEERKLYKQGKSTVLVLPSKFLRALNWAAQDYIHIVLLPDKTLRLSKGAVQRDILDLITPTPKQEEEAANDHH